MGEVTQAFRFLLYSKAAWLSKLVGVVDVVGCLVIGVWQAKARGQRAGTTCADIEKLMEATLIIAFTN